METNRIKQTLNIAIFSFFYLIAGLNHFIQPDFYYPLIPDNLPYPKLINIVAGLAEVLLALGVIFQKYRRIAAWGVIIMLLAFIPSHVFFITEGSCIRNGLCVPEWVGIARLVFIHPLLIYWAYQISKINGSVFRSNWSAQ